MLGELMMFTGSGEQSSPLRFMDMDQRDQISQATARASLPLAVGITPSRLR
ncbi:hypothetical protein SDC9_185895 [bioreactor metagenome]|uniref:Uncharacterized protein n=1 Tax=bioreactor metagenome TaxID=1076179 RepID=A0A645HH67_9ZZZZ